MDDSLDAVSAALGVLRTTDGSPSYAEIARRIARRRGSEPAKVTVYDCFRPGRRRLDADLVADIVIALGGSDDDAEAQRHRVRGLNGDRVGVHVSVHVGQRSQTLIGRDALVARDADADIVVLTGLAGVGKSAIASARVAGARALTVELRASDPGRPSVAPVDVLRRMLGALGVRASGHDIVELRARLRPLLVDTIVVLEDAGSVADTAPLVIPGVRTIITARRAMPALRVHVGMNGLHIAELAVPPLDTAAATWLLERIVGADRSGDLGRITALGGGIPMELVMLAGAVRAHADWSIDDVAERLEREPRHARLRPALMATFEALSTPEAEALINLALIARELDADIAAAAVGGADGRVLHRLGEQHLVAVTGSHVTLHEVVFTAAREWALTSLPLSERRARVAAVAAATVARMDDDGDPHWAAREVNTVTAVAAAAHQHGLDTETEALALAAHPALFGWAMWPDTFALHDLASRGRALERPLEVALNVASAVERLGRYDEALITLHRVRRIATGVALARTWNQIGNVQRLVSRLDEALASYDTSIALAREIGNAMVEGRALGNRADVLRLLTRYDDAERGYQSAMRLSTEADDVINLQVVAGNRALMLLSTGRFDEAAALMDENLADTDRPQPHNRLTLALIAEAQGDDVAAASRAAEAKRVADQTGDFGVGVDVELMQARIRARAGDIDEAAASIAAILTDIEQSGSLVLMIEAGNSLAEIELIAGRLDEAERRATAALELAELTGDRAEVARSRITLGGVLAASGEDAAGATLIASGHELYREVGHYRG